MQFGRGKPSAGAFYDSDFSTIDQVLAVGLLNGLQGKNDCRVAIVTMSRPNLTVIGYIDAVERYYRGPAGNFAQVPPIGMRTAGKAGDTSPAFTVAFEKNPKLVNHVKTVIDTGDPDTLFRNYLEAQYDQNGFFILTGPATNLAAALDFRGMKDLITAKIKYLVASFPEQNLKADIPAAKKVLSEWPTPVYVVGDEVGTALPFPGASIEKEFALVAENPFSEAYKAYKPMPYDTPSWAMAATLYAGRPKEGYFKVSDPGTVTVRDDGKLSFAPSAQGRHQTLSVDPDQKEKVIQAYVDLTSAKPVFPQRFRPPVAADKKAAGETDKKDQDKKPEDEKKPEEKMP